MKREILIGLGGLACAGAILGGVVLKNNDFSFIKPHLEEDNKQKIEDLWKEELRNTNKYSFCLGEMKINTEHNDSALGFNGTIDYTSKEVIVYNKESEKLFIMSRSLQYTYYGTISKTLGGMADIDVPVKENGSLTETYQRNEMPIRLDYFGKYVATDPDTKNKQWVNILIGEETSLGTPHHGCAGMYTLNNSPGKDLLLGGEQIIIEKECEEAIIGASYNGSFRYECDKIDYKQAIDTYETHKNDEELQNSKNMEVFENEQMPEVERASGTKEDPYNPSSIEDIKKSIEDMKLEMKADQTSQ